MNYNTVKFFSMILIMQLIGCSSANRVVAPSNESRALDQLVATKNYVIESDWASPQVTAAMASIANSGLLGPGNNANNINLIGNPNFLKVEGDTISAFLPYYGERQMGGGYATDNGIEFKGIPEKYSLEKNETKQSYVMKFSMKAEDSNEIFDFIVDFYSNKRTNIKVNSSFRFPISYQGNVAPIAIDK